MKFTSKIHKAINIASWLHGGTSRKTDNDIPYIVHPFSVAFILSEYTDDEDVIAAGLLHDVLEDVEGYSARKMEEDFGQRVLKLVQEVSEDKKPGDKNERETWDYRKNKYLKDIEKASKEALLIACADKIHNLSSTVDAYQRKGKVIFEKFNAPMEKRMRYYEKILKIFKKHLDCPIVREFEDVYEEAVRVIGDKYLRSSKS